MCWFDCCYIRLVFVVVVLVAGVWAATVGISLLLVIAKFPFACVCLLFFILFVRRTNIQHVWSWFVGIIIIIAFLICRRRKASKKSPQKCYNMHAIWATSKIVPSQQMNREKTRRRAQQKTKLNIHKKNFSENLTNNTQHFTRFGGGAICAVWSPLTHL